MYTKYWNLREAPFINSYNPRQLYHSSQFEEGVARLFYLVSEGRVAGILTGQFGMGKSFLLSNLTERINQAGIPYIRIDAIPKGHLALLRHVIAGLGVKGTVASIADGLMTLQELSRKPGALKRHAILIDEAQYLGDDDGLYLIHYLTNLRLTSSDGREQQLATVIMAGIPELLDMVRSYQSLRARVQLTWTLDPLTHSETIEFVQHDARPPHAQRDHRVRPAQGHGGGRRHVDLQPRGPVRALPPFRRRAQKHHQHLRHRADARLRGQGSRD